MILTVEDVRNMLPESSSMTDEQLQMKLNALELMIRKYTNNNFQNRNIRFKADSNGFYLNGSSPFLKVGDTIQVSTSLINNGLYVLTEVNDVSVRVDKELYSTDYNLVTKVEYPDDIKIGIINLLKYDVQMGDKVGIKSETISRHSVTYADVDSSNQVMGYPVSLLGFLKPYMKARF